MEQRLTEWTEKVGVRDTSRQAFKDITRELGLKQKEVYKALCAHPMACNAELAYDLGWPINTVTPRCKELRDDMGIVSDVGTKTYKPTGRSVHCYVATAGRIFV